MNVGLDQRHGSIGGKPSLLRCWWLDGSKAEVNSILVVGSISCAGEVKQNIVPLTAELRLFCLSLRFLYLCYRLVENGNYLRISVPPLSNILLLLTRLAMVSHFLGLPLAQDSLGSIPIMLLNGLLG